MKPEYCFLDIHIIRKIGNWRYPFSFVDKIVSYKKGKFPEVRGIKNVTMNEPFFMGHYPHYPIFPGVLIAEALGQTAGYLDAISFIIEFLDTKGLNTDDYSELCRIFRTDIIDEPIKEITKKSGLLAAQNLKYLNPVYPGDTIDLHVRRLSDKGGFVTFQVLANVRNVTCAKGEITNYRDTDFSWRK